MPSYQNIVRSPYPDAVIPEVPVTEYVLRHARRLAEKPAFIDGPTGRALSFGALEDAVRRLAGGLKASGFGPGNVLALMAPNCPEYAIVFHGVALAGASVTTLNPAYTPGEIHHQLIDAGASILVTATAALETAKAAAEGTGVKEIVVIDSAPGYRSLSDLFGAPLAQQVGGNLDDTVVLPYSSGTTGLSKGVMLTHRNLVANLVQMEVSLGFEPEREVFIVSLPMFHIYGMQVLMNMGTASGDTVVTMPRFDLEQFLKLNVEHGGTIAACVPPMVLALAKSPVVDNYKLTTLKRIVSGAAPLSAELTAECKARIGCDVVQAYGMTELSPVTHATPLGKAKDGAVGVLTPNTELLIVDPGTGESVGPNLDGEIWVRGPQVMKGYLNNPEATAATIVEDGWLRTGDIGHVDADGYLSVVDRLKELIKYKGFQVPPAELEALLLTHPDIADAAVVGLPDDEAGEIPVGYVVLKPGRSTTPEEIQAFVAGQVATYKQLRRMHIIDAVPKSASGKILRRLLRDQAKNA